MKIITETPDLIELCDRLADERFVTVDTEFIREKTYWPKLCLVQVAGDDPDTHAAIDPIAGNLDLSPLFELFDNEKVLKVFHAARQDIEIFQHLSGRVPHPLFDTQVAAMVCGFGESVGYETLVSKLVGARIDKTSRFTDWARRPLTDKQIAYAMSDVTHLRTIFERLSAMLEESGRAAWVREEMDVLADPETYITRPNEAWERIRTRSTDGAFLAVVRELAAWREVQAQKRNVPRNYIAKDETLLEMASSQPSSAGELKHVRGLPKWAADGAGAAELLEVIARARALPKSEHPVREQSKALPRGLGPLVDLLKVLLKMKCEEHGVARTLIANAADLEQIAAHAEDADLPALKGWRWEVFGADAVHLVEGRVGLSARGRRIAVVSLDGDEQIIQASKRRRKRRRRRKGGEAEAQPAADIAAATAGGGADG